MLVSGFEEAYSRGVTDTLHPEMPGLKRNAGTKLGTTSRAAATARTTSLGLLGD